MAFHKTDRLRRARRREQRIQTGPVFDLQPLERRLFLSGTLTGTVSAPASTTNLTALGTANWSHWGDSTTPVSMSGVTPINFTPIGTATVNTWPTVPDAFSWSNGTPTASASGDASTVYSSGLSTGYQLVMPADTQQRTVSLFIGAFAATGQLTATFSDNSASPYVATLDSTSTTVSTLDVYTITYQASSPAQSLTLQWVQTNTYVSGGNIGLEALALTATPPAPTNLAAVPGNAQNSLSWSPSTNAASYTVERGTASGAESILASGITSASYTDTTVTNGTTYYYTVVANNDFGSSVASSEGSAIPGPSLLGGSVAAAPALTDLTTLGTANWSHWGDSTTPISMSGVSPINFTQIGSATLQTWPTVSDAFSWSNGTPSTSASGDASTLYSSGLSSGYQLVMPADTQQRTVNLFIGAFAATGQLTATLSDGSAAPFVATLDSTSTTVSTLDVYTITYQASSPAQTLTLRWVQTNMYVSGGNIGLEGFSLAAAPATPTGLAVSATTSTSVSLGWSASAGATNYSIFRKGFGDSTFVQVGDVTGTTFTDAGASPGTSYRYEVSAQNAAGSSAPSAAISAATIPGISISDDGGVPEGENYTVNVTVSYTGTDPITSLSIDWGDGTTSTPSAHSGAFTHVYDDSGLFLVTATVESPAGAGHKNLLAPISDPTPSLEIAVSDSTVEQGATVTVTPTLTINSIDRLTGWVVDWGDGTIDNYGADATPSFNHAYAHGLDGGIGYSITVAADTSVGVFAADGGISVTAPTPPPPPPVPPAMWISSTSPAIAGQPWDLTVITCAVSSPPSSYSVDFGDGTTGSAVETADLGGTNIEYDATHTYQQEGLYYVEAGDSELNRSDFFNIGEPTPTLAPATDQTVAFGASVTATTTVSGLNINETYTAFIQWGQGGAERPAEFTAAGDGTGTITGSLAHAYASSTVAIILYNQDGNATSTTFSLTTGLMPEAAIAAAPATTTAFTSFAAELPANVLSPNSASVATVTTGEVFSNVAVTGQSTTSIAAAAVAPRSTTSPAEPSASDVTTSLTGGSLTQNTSLAPTLANA